MSQRITLTGIKPTGTPHLGNYLGAIRPALEAAANDDAGDSFFFVADYHALTTVHDREQFSHLTYEVAATWLACGLDPERSAFYRQSDLPEVFELTWMLACVCGKGLMNRSHAYKAIVQDNEERGIEDLDAGVNMGLFNYPILMAADILLYDAHVVPVGKDQRQHLEYTVDLAQGFNHRFGETFVVPEGLYREDVGAVPGLDGRKMSKSYGNTIPLFVPENKLLKLIKKIKTDSTPPEEPKNPDESMLFTLYSQFATHEQRDEMHKRYLEGVGWGDVKKALFEVINAHLKDARERYDELMADKAQIEAALKIGADRARPIAEATLMRARKAIGKSGI